MSKPWVYIASPYTKGDVAINTRFQCQVFHELMNEGIVWPFAPLVGSHFQHFCFPRPYRDWIDYDLALLPKMDACLRLNVTALVEGIDYWVEGYQQAESTGADGEVAKMKELNKPVFYNKTELYKWVSEVWHGI